MKAFPIWRVKVRLALVASVAAFSLGGHIAMACTQDAGTRVDAIYPSGPVVPENMLRFYLYFSAPMSDKDVLPMVTLQKDDGSKVEGAFLSNRFELWSPDRTRLTLLFDPGRVKTGLDAHNALGRALTAGERYQLNVDTSAADANGCALAEPFAHSFAAANADATPPDPETWRLDVPKTATSEPLRISLGSAHDHLSMAFKVRVQRNGEVVPGRIELLVNETVWVFTPRAQWEARQYEIVVGDEFEDLAGNRPGQLFDQPISAPREMPNRKVAFAPRRN